ncbi:MAG: hypothetical protein LUF85_02300 [Bacteroides sp.]|nr:hypothetical protein [Bacteroides sp.]
MKKLFFTFLCVVYVFSFCACSNEEEFPYLPSISVEEAGKEVLNRCEKYFSTVTKVEETESVSCSYKCSLSLSDPKKNTGNYKCPQRRLYSVDLLQTQKIQVRKRRN